MLRRFLSLAWLAAIVSGCAPWHELPGPMRQVPELRADALVASDGAVLPLRRWGPTGDPRAVVLALHGFNDYSRAFAEPAKAFTAARIVTYAYDQRGFGKAPHKGTWSSVDAMTDDLRTAVRLIRARHPGVPFYIVGESMGAAVVLAAMNQDRPQTLADGYVLSAPAVWARRVMPWWQRVGLEVLAHTLPLLHVTGQGFNRTPSDNIDMLRKLGRDPLVIKYTRIDALYGLVDLMDAALDAAPRLPGNTLVLFGQKEDIVPNEAMEALLAALPKEKCVRIVRYRSGYHMLLRDLKADIVLRDLVAWMEDPAGDLPSGADHLAQSNLSLATQGSGAASRLALDCDRPIAQRP